MSGWRVLALLMWLFICPVAFCLFVFSPLFLGGWIYSWLAGCGLIIAGCLVSKVLHGLAEE